MPTSRELWPSTSLDRALSIDHQYEDSVKKWQGIPGCGPDYSAHEPAVVHKKAEPIVSWLLPGTSWHLRIRSQWTIAPAWRQRPLCVDQTRATRKRPISPNRI